MPLDATASWQADTVGTPTGYLVTWLYNSAAQTPYTVPVTAAQDAAGYTQDFATANPSIVVKAGDVIDITVQTIDATNNLFSTAVTAPPVTEPSTPVPPGPPVDLTLVLS